MDFDNMTKEEREAWHRQQLDEVMEGCDEYTDENGQVHTFEKGEFKEWLEKQK